MKLKDFLKPKSSAAPKQPKTLYTTNLIRAVAKKKRFSQSTVAEVLSGLLSEIQEAVAQGNTVQLTDFGAFSSTLRQASTMRNVRTQQVMNIEARLKAGAGTPKSAAHHSKVLLSM